MKEKFVIIACCSIFLLILPAFGQIGKFEQLWGATNINGISGNGGLTAGFSAQGDITILKWPSPSYYEHLNYLTSRDEDARQKPHFGALENMGAFAGLYVVTDKSELMTWLRDPPWEIAQSYNTEDSNVLVTNYTHADLGIEVTSYQFVHPSMDILVCSFKVRRLAGSSVTQAKLFFFENLAPCHIKLKWIPLADWFVDGQNDFAVMYDSRKDALVHFSPYSGSLFGLDNLLTGSHPDLQSEVNNFIDELDDVFGRGIYIAIGGGKGATSQGHQCGFDQRTLCPKNRTRPWDYFAQDAYDDCSDGELSGSPIAACQADAALQWDLVFNGDDTADVSVIFSFASKASDAFNQLADARAQSVADLMQQTEAYWSDWISRARLPETDDEQLIRVCKRSLIVLKTYTDRETGLTVDAIQPPWQSWPLDVSDHNLALDIAGYHEMVTKQNLFLTTLQRHTDHPKRPIGTFAQAYYTDGLEAGPLPFIISWPARVIWSWWEHVKFLDDPDKRRAYLESVYPAIRLAANTLADCKDATNNLPCPASFMESIDWKQTLWDAVQVHLALVEAIEAGEVMSEDSLTLEKWRTRVAELEDAIRANYGVVEEGWHFWIWPGRVIPYDDPMMPELAQSLLEELSYNLEGKSPENCVVFLDGWHLTSLARVWANLSEGSSEREWLKWAISVFAHDISTKFTDHFGDDYVSLNPGDEDPQFLTITSTPNAFGSSNIYIAAMAIYNPEIFDELDNWEYPEDDTDDDTDDDSSDDDEGQGEVGSGCGCWVFD